MYGRNPSVESWNRPDVAMFRRWKGANDGKERWKGARNRIRVAFNHANNTGCFAPLFNCGASPRSICSMVSRMLLVLRPSRNRIGDSAGKLRSSSMLSQRRSSSSAA